MKKINTTLLLGALLGFCACHFESFDERCAREAREYTEKQCPRRMDQYTLMDSLTLMTIRVHSIIIILWKEFWTTTR